MSDEYNFNSVGNKIAWYEGDCEGGFQKHFLTYDWCPSTARSGVEGGPSTRVEEFVSFNFEQRRWRESFLLQFRAKPVEI